MTGDHFTKSQLKTAYDWHVCCVFNDADFARKVEVLAELEKRGGTSDAKHGELVQSIANQFAVSPFDIQRYRVGKKIYLAPGASAAELVRESGSKEFSIKFGIAATREEVLEQWQNFEVLRAELFPVKDTKRKAPEQPELVYAIFKCRQAELNFPEIFDLYVAGELPGYNKPGKHFVTVKELRDYYNRYRPSVA